VRRGHDPRRSAQEEGVGSFKHQSAGRHSKTTLQNFDNPCLIPGQGCNDQEAENRKAELFQKLNYCCKGGSQHTRGDPLTFGR
jgi:hypothetical protein